MKLKVKKWKTSKLLILLLSAAVILILTGCRKDSEEKTVPEPEYRVAKTIPEQVSEVPEEEAVGTAEPEVQPQTQPEMQKKQPLSAISVQEIDEAVIVSEPAAADAETVEPEPIAPPVSIETGKPVSGDENIAEVQETEPQEEIPVVNETEESIETPEQVGVEQQQDMAVETGSLETEPPAVQTAAAENRPEPINIEDTTVGKAVLIGKAASINITTPATPFYYRSELNITGVLSGIPSDAVLTWNIPETELSGKLERTGQDSFKAIIDLTNIEGTQVCQVAAYSNGKILAEDLLVMVDDNRGPYMEFTTPDQSEYSRDLIISGRIKDSAESSSINEVKTFKITCLNTSEIYSIDFSDDGFFSFPLNRLSGNFSDFPSVLLQFTAEDFNNNISTDYLSLYTADNSLLIDITSPGNGTTFTDSISVRGKAEGVRKISWNIIGTGLSGASDVESGVFIFDVKTSGLGDTAIIKLTAESGDEISERYLKFTTAYPDLPSIFSSLYKVDFIKPEYM